MRQAREAKNVTAPVKAAPKRTTTRPAPVAKPVAKPAAKPVTEEAAIPVEAPQQRRGWGRKAKKTQDK